MTLWTVKIGQGASQRTQARITDIKVSEGFAHTEFEVTIDNPITDERTQSKGRIDAAIIQIKRGSDILVEGFIEDVEGSGNYVKYTGRSFLVLLGYSTTSKTTSSGDGTTDAEYEDDTGKTIIDDLINTYCYSKDSEITKTVTFPETYGSKITLHGKKVYQMVREMCQSYGYDLWSDATWNVDGINIDNKNIYVGEKSRGTDTVPHDTLYGGQHLKDIPIIKYRSSQAINYLHVIGGGTGKDKVSIFVEDLTSIAAIGYIEGEPYHNNMIRDVTTAQLVGQAIIDAKKDPIEELQVNLAMYINDLKYGDWVRIVDAHSNIDVIKRIKKIIRTYNINTSDSMAIELGEKFDDYQNIIRDLTKGDVDSEPKMSLAGGSLRITANDPPDTYIRIDGGDWYGTDGVLYTYGNTVRVFWGGSPPYNATTVNNYFKALVQIKDGAASSSDITYKTSLTAGAHTGYAKDYAKAEVISADSGYMPIGEIILKCCNGSGAVCDVTATDEGDSFIYRDARPIVGSSASGFGGDVLNPMTANLAAGGFKLTGLGAGVVAGDALRYEQLVGVYLPLGGGTMTGNINMGYNTIYNSDDITLYDNTVNSPTFALTTNTGSEGGTGIYMSVSDGTDLKIYENATDTEIARLEDDGFFTLQSGLLVGSNILMGTNKITGLGDPLLAQDAATKIYVDDNAGMWELSTENTWTASTVYSVGDFVGPTTPNDRSFECTTGGTSGGSEPTWNTTPDGTTTDNTTTWTTRYIRMRPKVAYEIDLLGEGIKTIEDITAELSNGIKIYEDDNTTLSLILANNITSPHSIIAYKPIEMSSQKIEGLAAATAAGDALRYEQLVGVYLPLGGGTMTGNINMNAKDITGLDDLTMNGSGSIVDMNYGSITDCNNLTMYDANVDSPILAMVTSNTESGTGMWMYVAAGKNLKIYENFGDTLLAQLDYDGDLSLNGGLSVGSAKITGLAAATANGNAVRYEEFKAIPGTNATSFIIDQDNTGAGVSSSLRFNRGSTDGDAAIWWDETQDEFQFDSDVAVTIGSIRINEVRFNGSDKITQNSSTGDMEFTVATGDSFVFKTV